MKSTDLKIGMIVKFDKKNHNGEDQYAMVMPDYSPITGKDRLVLSGRWCAGISRYTDDFKTTGNATDSWGNIDAVWQPTKPTSFTNVNLTMTDVESVEKLVNSYKFELVWERKKSDKTFMLGDDMNAILEDEHLVVRYDGGMEFRVPVADVKAIYEIIEKGKQKSARTIKKSDLKTGHHLILRDEDHMIVMLDTAKYAHRNILTNGTQQLRLSYYDEDLTYRNNSMFDVVAIARPITVRAITDTEAPDSQLQYIWKEDEDTQPLDIKIGAWTTEIDWSSEILNVGCKSIPFADIKAIYEHVTEESKVERFKVGDTVKVISQDPGDVRYLGEVGTVTKVDTNDTENLVYKVRFNDYSYQWFRPENELVHAEEQTSKFEKGDIVYIKSYLGKSVAEQPVYRQTEPYIQRIGGIGTVLYVNDTLGRVSFEDGKAEWSYQLKDLVKLEEGVRIVSCKGITDGDPYGSGVILKARKVVDRDYTVYPMSNVDEIGFEFKVQLDVDDTPTYMRHVVPE